MCIEFLFEALHDVAVERFLAAELLQHLARPGDMAGVGIMRAQVRPPAAWALHPITARAADEPTEAVQAMWHVVGVDDVVVAKDFPLVPRSSMVGDDDAWSLCVFAHQCLQKNGARC